MYLTDYHSHSMCSVDSDAPLLEMAQGAVKMGMAELCTTDHYDMLTQTGEIALRLDWAEILDQYTRTLPLCPPELQLRLGIELGSAQINPTLAQQIVDDAPLDFVIGSIHNAGKEFDFKDIFFMDFRDKSFCHRLIDDYLDQMTALAPLPCYDTMAHLIYPFRYMPPMGAGYFEPQYFEKFRTLLTKIVESGHGIELNTTRSRDLSPWKPVMELYKSCGGEIITIGSDGHFPHQVGVGIQEAQALLRTVGFRYQTTYAGRKPHFIKL